METINQSLYIGTPKRGIDLFCNVGINGRHKFRMHAESFVGPFIHDLHALIHGGHVRRMIVPGTSSMTNAILQNSMVRQENGDVRIDTGSSRIYQGAHYDHGSVPDPSEIPLWAHIYECSGIPELNRSWRITKIESSGRYTFVSGIPEEIDVSAWNQQDGRVTLRFFGNITTYHDYVQPFRNVTPTVGVGVKPVSIRDFQLERTIDDKLSLGANSISTLVTDQEKSVFNVSRAFTNNTGEDVVIMELGLHCPFDSNSFRIRTPNLFARDVLDAPTHLPNGKTLTLDYECLFELENFNQNTEEHGSNGGFLARFANALRMSAIQDRRIYPEAHLLVMGFGGGMSNTDTGQSVRRSSPGWEYGIRLGESSRYVSMTDQQLSPDATVETPYNSGGIRHGHGDGELVHHGMVIDDEVTYDDASNSVKFSLARVFENRGSIPITVKEVGLYGQASTSTGATSVPGLMARRALHPDDHFTIQAGEMKKVSYTIKMIA